MYLLVLLLIFGFLTPSYQYNEFGLVEITQVLMLGIALLIHLSCKKYFLKLSNKFIYITRAFLLFFLLYEEISHVTKFFIPISKSINLQLELNIHNSTFANEQILFQLPLPFTNHQSSVSLLFFGVYISSFLLGCGLFLPYLKRFRYLFWEKKYAIFSFVSFINLSFSAYIREVYNSSFTEIIHAEYVEFFLYLVFLLDVLQKRKIMKKIYNIKK